jgi:hypothetical protein
LTDVSEVLTASIVRAMRNVSQFLGEIPGATCQKTVIFILAALRS